MCPEKATFSGHGPARVKPSGHVKPSAPAPPRGHTRLIQTRPACADSDTFVTLTQVQNVGKSTFLTLDHSHDASESVQAGRVGSGKALLTQQCHAYAPEGPDDDHQLNHLTQQHGAPAAKGPDGSHQLDLLTQQHHAYASKGLKRTKRGRTCLAHVRPLQVFTDSDAS